MYTLKLEKHCCEPVVFSCGCTLELSWRFKNADAYVPVSEIWFDQAAELGNGQDIRMFICSMSTKAWLLNIHVQKIIWKAHTNVDSWVRPNDSDSVGLGFRNLSF